MNTSARPVGTRSTMARARGKVPEITVAFWIFAILALTVGETIADYLAENLELGLTNATYIMGTALIVSMVFQFRSRQYVPGIYWSTVVLLTIVGALITDNLVAYLGISLAASAALFAATLAITFVVWHAVEHTVSVSSIHTIRREAFYWLAMLLAVALVASIGDLVARSLRG